MFLKKLESVGFKSFAERINVSFVPGVTAVVGPNGSGKSNITDALRWVLGEQSARSLRGSKMEDIIFQGSETRKKLNVAEVNLLLDNTKKQLPIDYDEVSVTRRVYRSGESEFYINKQACRLKDIVDLFMDSGLGREAFSIISQGKVEEILSSKAEERRTIFEEAAGVLKYKQRKRKAEFKLSETKENLNRVEDIMHEILQQIEPLEKQAEKAKKYLHYKSDLKEQEVSLLVTVIEEIHQQYETLKNDMEHEKLLEIDMQTNINKKQAELESVRQEVQKQDGEIENVQTQLVEVIKTLEQLSGKKQVLKERIKHFAENKEKLEKQNIAVTNRIKDANKKLQHDEKDIQELKGIRKEAAKKIKQLEKMLGMKGEAFANQIDNLKSLYIDHLNTQAAKRNELQSLAQQQERFSRKATKQRDQLQELVDQQSKLQKKNERADIAFLQAEKSHRQLEKKMDQLKKEVSHEQQTFREGQTKLYQGYRHIENLKSKKELLEDMKDEFQGFFLGVKAVLQAKQKGVLQKIDGAVIELLEVDKQYITAIDTVLGGSSQHIVVKNDHAAREAIAWLKKTNNGRCTFLPLESIQARFIPIVIKQRLEQYDGFVGMASDLVFSKEKYQKVIDHLMGHVIIASSLKAANEMAKLAERRYRIVTLEGDVVNPGGAMSGGAQKRKTNSLFTREKDLQEMTLNLATYEQKAVELEATLQSKKQRMAQKEQELEELETSIYKSYQKYQETKTTVSETQSRLEQLEDNFNVFNQEKRQFSEDSSNIQYRKQQLEKDLVRLQDELANTETMINTLTARQKDMYTNREKLQTEYYDTKISLAEQDERIKNHKERIQTNKNELQSMQVQQTQIKNELNDLMRLKQEDDHAGRMTEILNQKTQEKEELTARIQDMRHHRSQRGKWMDDQDRELKEETKAHSSKIKQMQAKEVAVNRLDVALENYLSQLSTDYALTFERAKETYQTVGNKDEAEMAVNQLKTNIEALGTVNTGAIEEYERIFERKEFLSVQQNDLIQALTTLRDIIAEMDAEMAKLFGNTFHRIKEEFATVFKELFAGGQAELKLTNAKNLLETGVDIIAQPPGKKLQHLSLLSGGERALTAIALLFAILRVRPVPFCVLDEVEAALDEANVVRFAKYIKKYSDNTQFIVITHRKGTMEEADALYGVTMQESGVSRLVSVRLEETNELISL